MYLFTCHSGQEGYELSICLSPTHGTCSSEIEWCGKVTGSSTFFSSLRHSTKYSRLAKLLCAGTVSVHATPVCSYMIN